MVSAGTVRHNRAVLPGGAPQRYSSRKQRLSMAVRYVMPEPSVIAIILNWNGLQDTRECLESLRHVNYSALRTVVVDNGSRDDEAGTLATEFGSFIDLVRLPVNRGFAGGA